MPHSLAAHGEFGNCPARRGFAGLSAGVGIHFGVQHEDVDVAPGGKHVIQSAVADVVGPTVAAHDPYGLLDEAVGNADQILGAVVAGFRQFVLQGGNAFALFIDARFSGLVGVQNCVHQICAQFLFKLRQQFARIFVLLVDGQAHAQTKLGVIFKQRVRPRGSASVGIHSPRGGGEVAAVDGGTACGVGDDGAVTEELGDQFHVGGLTASRAGAAEFKQRAEQLRILDGGGVDQLAVQIGDFHEEIPVLWLRIRAGQAGEPC